MKSFFNSILVSGLLALALFTCNPQCEEVTYMVEGYAPEYISNEELDSSIQMEAPRPIEKPGKIYVYGDVLLVNEINQGLHIIDNTNPASPLIKGFLTIPGNLDMVMQGHYIYADNGPDLVALDLSNPGDVKVSKRLPNTFDTENRVISPPQSVMDEDTKYIPFNTEQGVFVDWKDTLIPVTETNCQ